MGLSFHLGKLRQDAQNRWLKNSEVLFILQNHENLPIEQETPEKPTSGSLFLFNRRVLKFFRKDGHMWRKKKDGRAVGEAHERLKVCTIFMDLQNASVTVQLGRGASIQLANTLINTGRSGATIQFGSIDFPAVVARAATAPTRGIESKGHARKPQLTEAATRRAHLPTPRPAAENPRGRISVFERLSQSEIPTTRRIVTDGKISVVPTRTTTLPMGSSVPGRNVAEASSSGGRPTRRQRRKMNAEL
ncbi:hypothetical protein IEQ34_003740 [Dendrobium chrysotoxum]|uniref:CG-1 domain-containing protein n=1 Tax=Dendrobium chrysotoxum TaxID=161865 RepID=A0AAV7HF77_DENCH|nr:hypothetical protein IEQ34_003740 [Dendrobium chrysotoxum]